MADPPSKSPLLSIDDVNPEIGLLQEKLIGRVVVQWSNIEAGLNNLIWGFLRLSIEDGRVLTGRMDAQIKIAMIRKLAPRFLTGEPLYDLTRALKLADSVRDDRNFIVHGSWATKLADGLPLAVSIRAKSDPGEVLAEQFPPERMRIILRDIS